MLKVDLRVSGVILDTRRCEDADAEVGLAVGGAGSWPVNREVPPFLEPELWFFSFEPSS